MSSKPPFAYGPAKVSKSTGIIGIVTGQVCQTAESVSHLELTTAPEQIYFVTKTDLRDPTAEELEEFKRKLPHLDGA